MTLEEMLRKGEIEELETSPEELENLLKMAERRLRDAKAMIISNEVRFEQAYHVILTCATVVLRSLNLRVTSGDSKHVRTIESLLYTLGKSKPDVRLFQKYRKKRNLDLYEGFVDVSEIELAEAIRQAETVLDETKRNLQGPTQRTSAT